MDFDKKKKSVPQILRNAILMLNTFLILNNTYKFH